MFNSSTSEIVSKGHPDKACDRVSDEVQDELLNLSLKRGETPEKVRAAVETTMKGRMVLVTGEISASDDVLNDFDLEIVVKKAWSALGYDHIGEPLVMNRLEPQAPEIANLVDQAGLASGAGDQGIMLGHAVNSEDFMPPDYTAARKLLLKLEELRLGELDWLRSDAKSQVSMSQSGEIMSVILSTQHSSDITLESLREHLLKKVVRPTLGDLPSSIVKINAKGSFVAGGPVADAGLTGRKIVVDQYGPSYPVGGGAFSGKDPSKVDRSAAYMARLIAKTALATEFSNANSVSVQLAYGIGQVQPEAVCGRTDGGVDISSWISGAFPDLSPGYIQESLGLWKRDGWRYTDLSAYGHFGRPNLPWEKV